MALSDQGRRVSRHDSPLGSVLNYDGAYLAGGVDRVRTRSGFGPKRHRQRAAARNEGWEKILLRSPRAKSSSGVRMIRPTGGLRESGSA